MGCSQSSSLAAVTSADVDKQLDVRLGPRLSCRWSWCALSNRADAADADRNHIKILLLGAGESGKSTVLKQVKMIFKGHMGEKDQQQCIGAIRKNAIECMQTVLNAMHNLGIELGHPENHSIMKMVRELDEDVHFTPEVADCIATLWADPGVRSAYERQDQYWLLDAASYYFNEVVRLGDPYYEPTDDDIIMTRVRTTGIDTTDFSEPPRTYSVVDVGGQRNERRKWIHCFDNVKAVVFLVGLNGYNQRLFEDSNMNKMQESLKLFKQVVSNPIFREVPVFLFLNKKDIFETMIRRIPLSVCFPEYRGKPGDVHEALAFVEKQYRTIVDATCPNKPLFVHVVAARVRMDMKVAWIDVKDQLKKIYSSKRSSRPWGTGSLK